MEEEFTVERMDMKDQSRDGGRVYGGKDWYERSIKKSCCSAFKTTSTMHDSTVAVPHGDVQGSVCYWAETSLATADSQAPRQPASTSLTASLPPSPKHSHRFIYVAALHFLQRFSHAMKFADLLMPAAPAEMTISKKLSLGGVLISHTWPLGQ